MNEQAKTINVLQTLGASYGTIEQEKRKLHELEALLFKDFRRFVFCSKSVYDKKYILL